MHFELDLETKLQHSHTRLWSTQYFARIIPGELIRNGGLERFRVIKMSYSTTPSTLQKLVILST